MQQEKEGVGTLILSSDYFLKEMGLDSSQYTGNHITLWLCNTCRDRNRAMGEIILSGVMILIFLVPTIFVLFQLLMSWLEPSKLINRTGNRYNNENSQ